MLTITSAQNPIIKEVKLLKERKFRELHKKYFIEGDKFVEEALLYPNEIDYIIISENFKNIHNISTIQSFSNLHKKKLFIISDKLFVDISDTKTPQGILATMHQRTPPLKELSPSSSFIVILDQTSDPGNLGTIIRTADAAKVDGILISKDSVDIYNPKVLRSTMGSIFHLPIYKYNTFDDVKNLLKAYNFNILTTHLKATKSIYDWDFKLKTAIIIGNEANGVSEKILEQSDHLIKIPMPGKAESLNAAVATSVIIYECLRQRN
jgi:TrmH family RNA methyltransferase